MKFKVLSLFLLCFFSYHFTFSQDVATLHKLSQGQVTVVLAPGDVMSTTGLVWKDSNIGATRVATASSDAFSYGDLFQWGRSADGHESRTSSTTNVTAKGPLSDRADFIIGKASIDYNWTDFAGEDGLWQGGVNDPCPTGYRLPTSTELNNERLAFSSNTSSGAYQSPLKLPVGGYREGNTGNITGKASGGYYWSSTISGVKALLLYFNSGNAVILNVDRSAGASVRCVKK